MDEQDLKKERERERERKRLKKRERVPSTSHASGVWYMYPMVSYVTFTMPFAVSNPS